MIKVGYLVSYDYNFMLTSIKELYNHVDEIYIAIDKEGKTWSGNLFEIPQTFIQEIRNFDSRKIIKFYFDSFYVAGLSPVECDTRERNMLLKQMGKGWLIQLDVDEYIYDFKKVAGFLRKYNYLTFFPKLTPVAFKGKLITLYRQLSDGYLYIDNGEQFSFITNQNSYTYVRKNNKIRNHYTNICVIHQSWARTESEIQMKIDNWGHRDDFDTQKYFMFWKKLTSSNYKEHKNVHPIAPEVWSELKFLPSQSIDDFIKVFGEKNPQKLKHLDSKEMIKALFRKIRRLFIDVSYSILYQFVYTCRSIFSMNKE